MINNLFVKPGDELIIKVAVAIDKKEGKIYADAIKKDLEEMMKGAPFEIEEYTVTFRRPSFKDSVDISQGISTDGQNFKFDILANRYNKMKKLIKSWTFKDEEGNVLKATEENINSLNPLIASVILDQLDLATGNI